jgi:hypothetical protein
MCGDRGELTREAWDAIATGSLLDVVASLTAQVERELDAASRAAEAA